MCSRQCPQGTFLCAWLAELEGVPHAGSSVMSAPGCRGVKWPQMVCAHAICMLPPVNRWISMACEKPGVCQKRRYRRLQLDQKMDSGQINVALQSDSAATLNICVLTMKQALCAA